MYFVFLYLYCRWLSGMMFGIGPGMYDGRVPALLDKVTNFAHW